MEQVTGNVTCLQNIRQINGNKRPGLKKSKGENIDKKNSGYRTMRISNLSCDSTKVAENASALGVEFEWTDASECSDVSPPIRVTNIPEETKYLRVEMVDLDLPVFNHGGGEVAYDGSNALGEGALKSYAGPCPPAGVEHAYEITVQGLSADKKLVLGRGKAMRKFKIGG